MKRNLTTWVWISILLCGHASALTAAEPSPSSPDLRVDIFEGIPNEANWDFSASTPSETYSEQAFGFFTMPTRYSNRGVKTDRGRPFLFRASARLALPAGDHRLLLRAPTGSRFFVDGQAVLTTPFPDFKADGHEEVPEIPKAVAPEIRFLRPGHFESMTNFVSDGRPHDFVFEALIGLKDRRPELGESSVSVSFGDENRFYLLSPVPGVHIALTEEAINEFAAERRAHWKSEDAKARRLAAALEEKYWNWRHDLARKTYPAAPRQSGPSIDAYIDAKLKAAGVEAAPLADDFAFLRRVTLDTIGLIPTEEQVEAFARDDREDKRARVIDRLLAHPSWADHWVSYWQDVLAENPGILKPMLNNTGPFRWWIHESFLDNKPFDQFVTELIRMEEGQWAGGPAGFAMATQNDAPMAAKADILIAIDTTQAGSTAPAAELLASRLRASGFRASDLSIGGPRADLEEGLARLSRILKSMPRQQRSRAQTNLVSQERRAHHEIGIE
jgi:hypothetical protein